MSSISSFVQSCGGNWLTGLTSTIHSKIHFSKIDLNDELKKCSFIESVNKTNRLGGIIGIAVSVIGISAFIVTFYFTGSTIPLMAGLPLMPVLSALSINAVVNKLKFSSQENIENSNSQSPISNIIQQDPTSAATIGNGLNIETNPNNLSPREEAFNKFIELLTNKPPDEPLQNEIKNIDLFIEAKNTNLYLQFNNFNEKELKKIVDFLKKDTYYTSIDLSNNNFEPNVSDIIVDLILNKKNLKEINLSNNNFGNDGFERIMNSFRDKKNIINTIRFNNIKLKDFNLKEFINKSNEWGINEISLQKNSFKKLKNYSNVLPVVFETKEEGISIKQGKYKNILFKFSYFEV